ncbi:MAG: AsmA-like C-terminal region-containing protein, partial [Clostridiales bacterium]
MSTPLDKQMMPIWNSFNGQGTLNLANAQVSNFKPFEVIGNTLKINELKNPVLKNVTPSFKITNGRLYVNPFNYKVFNYDITLGGSSGIDRSMDYTMNLQIPAAGMQSQANKAINNLLKRNVNLVSTDKVNVKAFIKGKVNDPVVTTSVSDIVSQTTKSVTDQAK